MVDGISPNVSGLQPQLPATGINLSFGIPPGLTGTSVLFQGLVLDPTTMNGVYGATNGHEIQIL